MNILLITQATAVKRTWGITKVIIDASEAMTRAGATCECFPSHPVLASDYETCLREHLESTRGTYDVIEIPDTLALDLNPHRYAKCVVVRSVLLPLHRQSIHFRIRPTTLRSRIRHAVMRGQIEQSEARRIEQEIATVRRRLAEADLVNVANSRDREVLIRDGIAPEKIRVLPYGLNDSRRVQLEAIPRMQVDPDRAHLVFVGTFDFRKGCLDIVEVFLRYARHHPRAELHLLGTRGLMTSPQQVLGFFPRSLRSRIKVVESFSEEELPELLAQADIGLFPSYWEGFGISVVEQLAAGIPVVAYDAPGPCDILPAEWLVPPGDVQGMTERLLKLASERDPERARTQAKRFRWETIGEQTVAAYAHAIQSS